MPEKEIKETWVNRDLQVLAAIVAYFDNEVEDEFAEGDAVPVTTLRVENFEVKGLSSTDVNRSLIALANNEPKFFSTTVGAYSNRRITEVWAVTGEARRAVGTWPDDYEKAARWRKSGSSKAVVKF